MKKLLLSVVFVSVTVLCLAQVKKAEVNQAVDYLNCKLVELVLSGGDAGKLQKFKAACPCAERPDFRRLMAAIPARQTKTRRLAREIETIKNRLGRAVTREQIVGFLSQRIFDDYAHYPAVYEFATRRIEQEDFYDVKEELRTELMSMLQHQQAASRTVLPVAMLTAPPDTATVSRAEQVVLRDTEAVVKPAATAATGSAKGSDWLVVEERLAALEAARKSGSGLMDHKLFQGAVLALLVLLAGFLLFKLKGAPLTAENREEIKSFIDRKLLTKLGPADRGLPAWQAAGADLLLRQAGGKEISSTSRQRTENLPADTPEFDLIFTYDEKMILAKQHREEAIWKEKIDRYKSSVSFENQEELMEFLETEFDLPSMAVRKLMPAVAKNDAELLVVEVDEAESPHLRLRAWS